MRRDRCEKEGRGREGEEGREGKETKGRKGRREREKMWLLPQRVCTV